MFQRKLFRRALPVMLSAAMVLQSAPATALAAEGNAPQVVEQITEESSEPESASTEKSSEPESALTEKSSEPESASTEKSSESESASSEKSSEPESATTEERS